MIAKKKTLYIEDDVISDLEQDTFGHKHIADAIVKSILNTKPPYIIGIFGGWGTGKSSLLTMIKSDLSKNNIATVTIDAWRYSSAGNLRRAFLVHVANELSRGLLGELRRRLYTTEQETAPKQKSKFENPNEINWASVSSVLFTFVGITLIFLGFLFAAYAIRTLLQIDTLGEFFTKFDWIAFVDKFVDLAYVPFLLTLVNFVSFYIVQHPVTITHERIDADELFSYFFQKIVDQVTKKKKQLVIFIDNLDRLNDDKMVDALESIKAYINNDKCVFVVACDDNVVRSVVNESTAIPKIVDKEAGGRRAGEHYLDKFFQQTFRLPEYMAINLHDFALENLKTTHIYDELSPRIDINNLVSIILPSDVGSPRKVKRLLNEFISLYEIVKRRENENDGQLKKGTLTDNLEFLGKFSTLRAEYPSFYKALINDSGLLASITNMIQEDSKTVDERLRSLDTENISSLTAYIRKTRTITTNDIDPYIWLSQDILALGLQGNHYSQLRTSLADGDFKQVQGLLESSQDANYRVLLARVSARLATQRLVGIEQQNGVRVISHLVSQFDASVQSEIANSIANLIPEWPADVFSAEEILNVLRYAYGTSISTQKEKLGTQLLERLQNIALRQSTFSAILQNADVVENNKYTRRIQAWLEDILKPERQTIINETTDSGEQDKNLPNREFAEWLISEINTYSQNNLVLDTYYSQALAGYSAFRLLGDGTLQDIFLTEEGLGQNINRLYQILARRIAEGAPNSQFWAGILKVVERTSYAEDLEFCAGHVRSLISFLPVNLLDKIFVNAFLAVQRISRKTDEDKVSDQVLVNVFKQVLGLADDLRERKQQELSNTEADKLPECISELLLIPSLRIELLGFLDRYARKYGEHESNLLILGALSALSKSELGSELENTTINKVLDLDSYVNKANRETVLARMDLLISTNEQSKSESALQFLGRMVSLEGYREKLEVYSKSWLERLNSEAIDIVRPKISLVDLMMSNELLNPDDYVDRVIQLLPFGGDLNLLQAVFVEVELVSGSISPEKGKSLISAVLAQIAVLGTACPKALAVGSLWIESADDTERLSFDSNVISLYESSPNLDLPVHFVSWAGLTSDEIRSHLVQIYRIDVDSSLVANRNQATIKAVKAIKEDERKESVLFIWTQLVNDRDAAETFINVVKELLSYNAMISIRKDAVGIVRANTDPTLSISNLRLLASTVRKDVDDVDQVVDLFVNLFGRGAEDVQMAAQHVVPCLMAFRLTNGHKYDLAGAMREATTRSDEEIDLIESKARDLRLEWFRHKKRRWF